jgi:xanthine dehydrogenase/oxidase
MAKYRQSLALSFFFKFYEHLKSNELAVSRYSRGISRGFQDFENSGGIVGSSLAHLSGLKQATGEALYVDDIPKHESEKYAALVLSDRAHARIL